MNIIKERLMRALGIRSPSQELLRALRDANGSLGLHALAEACGVEVTAAAIDQDTMQLGIALEANDWALADEFARRLQESLPVMVTCHVEARVAGSGDERTFAELEAEFRAEIARMKENER